MKFCKKMERFKAVISHIICENSTIRKVIKYSANRLQNKFVVYINEEENSYGSKNDGEIRLGVGNIEKLYEICEKFTLPSCLEFNTDKKILNLITDDDLCIDIADLKGNTLNNTKFLNKDKIDSVDTLVINALAYTLYHEFGHVKYDNDNMHQIEKERTADDFAMTVLQDSCSHDANIRLEEKPEFIGAFLENIFILLVSKPKDAEITMSHPHPIERIYLFLEHFNIKNDSFLWEYTYDIIVKWANENHIAMTFEKDCSLSIKDKLLDAYHRFKK